MSPQEKLFFGGVCPSLRASTPKREREEGVPDPKKARLALNAGLDLATSSQHYQGSNAQARGFCKGKGKGGKGGKGKSSKDSWNWGQEWQQAARDLGWITTEGHWKALIWNPQTEALEEQPGATDVLIAETIELRKLITPDTIFRFQSLKGLTKAPQTAWVQLALEVSTRGQGIRAWDLAQSWIGCAAFHTLGCRLRRERGGLSTQARSLRW